MRLRFLALPSLLLIAAPAAANAQALKAGIEKLQESKVAEFDLTRLQAFLDQPAVLAGMAVMLVAAILLYLKEHHFPAVLLGAPAVLGYALRIVSHFVSSYLQLALTLLIPIFLIVFSLRVAHNYRKSHEDKDDPKEKSRERRPRTLKVRGVKNSEDEDEDAEDKAQQVVKLNRPFG